MDDSRFAGPSSGHARRGAAAALTAARSEWAGFGFVNDSKRMQLETSVSMDRFRRYKRVEFGSRTRFGSNVNALDHRNMERSLESGRAFVGNACCCCSCHGNGTCNGHNSRCWGYDHDPLPLLRPKLDAPRNQNQMDQLPGITGMSREQRRMARRTASSLSGHRRPNGHVGLSPSSSMSSCYSNRDMSLHRSLVEQRRRDRVERRTLCSSRQAEQHDLDPCNYGSCGQPFSPGFHCNHQHHRQLYERIPHNLEFRPFDRCSSISSGGYDQISVAQSSLYSPQSHLQKRASFFSKRVQSLCRPIGNAAPFVTCTSCSGLLLLPSELSNATGKQCQVQCGTCSNLITFEFAEQKPSSFTIATSVLVSEIVRKFLEQADDGSECQLPNDSYMFPKHQDFDSTGHITDSTNASSNTVNTETIEKERCLSESIQQSLEGGSESFGQAMDDDSNHSEVPFTNVMISNDPVDSLEVEGFQLNGTDTSEHLNGVAAIDSPSDVQVAPEVQPVVQVASETKPVAQNFLEAPCDEQNKLDVGPVAQVAPEVREALCDKVFAFEGQPAPPGASEAKSDAQMATESHASAAMGHGLSGLNDTTVTGNYDQKDFIEDDNSRQPSALDSAQESFETNPAIKMRSNSALSRGSSDAGIDDFRSLNGKNGSSFVTGILKRGLKDFRLFNHSFDGSDRPKISINGHYISERTLKKAEKKAGPVDPGAYWYDYHGGFWGVMGHECVGIIPPYIKEFNYPMPRNCSGGDTGVLVNGRELHQKDLDLLVGRGLPRMSGRSYIIEISGCVVDKISGKKLPSLGKLAPTIEKLKRGLGMHVPEGFD